MMIEYGDPILPERFWDKVYPEPNTGCWLWGAATHQGYGRFAYHGVNCSAHALLWETIYGKYAGTLDHLCRQRSCVRLDHLENVSHVENVRRGHAYRAPKTHCVNGHELTSENTYTSPNKWRACRVCRRAAWHRYDTKEKVS